MLQPRSWLAATASVGLHVGLLALLSQAQAMPKSVAAAPTIAISVALRASAASTPEPQKVQSPIQPSANRPKPTHGQPAERQKAKVAGTSRLQPVERQRVYAPREATVARPLGAQRPSVVAATPQTTAATPATRTPLPSTRPAGSVQEHYPARYRGPQPAPVYPRMAQRRGLEGTCIIEVLMDTRGDVITLALKQSTGHAVLDKAALAAVKSWKFIAPSGISGASKALVPVRFKLT